MNKVLEKIEALCNEKNMTKYRLAKVADIPYTTITNSFSNDTMPTISTLERMCKGLDITLAQFFSEADQYPDLTEEQIKILLLWDAIPREKRERAEAYLEGIAEK